MTTSTTEENGKAKAPGAVEGSKPKKQARVAPRRAHVARSEAKPPRKASPAKTAPKSRKKPEATRADSKTAKILGLLKRQGGATAKDLQKATGWQPHSVRGFLSGIISKKMGLTVTSTKAEDGERSYSIKT